MDAISIVAIITGISGCSVAILTHLKHSECCGVFKIDSRTPPPTVTPTPVAQTPINTPATTQKEFSV